MPEFNNSFAQGTKADAKAVADLIKVGVPLMTEDSRGVGVLPWSKVEAAITGDDAIGYARGWLIVRRAWLIANRPSALVDAQGAVAAARAKATKENKLSDFDENKVLGPIMVDLKDAQQLSWGEIMCRTDLTEGKCRKAYSSMAGKKDLGIRNGRGGRFAYDEPTLYLDNRKAEGAHIPSDFGAKRPAPEQLMNFRAKDAPAPAKKATAKKAAAPKASAKAS